MIILMIIYNNNIDNNNIDDNDVDIERNLLKHMLESLSLQNHGTGPASTMLQSMGVNVPVSLHSKYNKGGSSNNNK